MGQVTADRESTLVGDRTYRIDLPFSLTENGPYHFTLLPTRSRTPRASRSTRTPTASPASRDDDYSFT